MLSKLFTEYYGIEPAVITPLAGSGGDRVYFRLSAGDKSCVGVIGDNLNDCEAFVGLSRVFRSNGVNVPQVYMVSDDGMHYIQQDLGNTSLFSCLGEEGSGRYVKEAMKQLAALQTVSESEWIGKTVYGAFDRRQVMWDLNYFKYEYLKPSGVQFDEAALEDDFEALADRILSASKQFSGFMYRDCQSRNVMVDDGKLWWIDFQGGRKGPSLYDAVSFLWQAKAGFSPEFRDSMLEVYADTYCNRRPELRSGELLESVPLFALFRTLQVLGAYGFRGLVEKRAHFIESIPGALSNLRYLLNIGALDKYRELRRVALLLVNDKRFAATSVVKDGEKRPLTIKVFSFSYKKGYPADYTGNGGGFMFDCRGMHNPGRYPEYRMLTGEDKPVIDFLEERGEVQDFVRKAIDLVRPTVDRYISRGFSDLQVGFGCTGGQHRSVYCARHFAEDMARMYPEAVIRLIHREQGKDEILKSELKN